MIFNWTPARTADEVLCDLFDFGDKIEMIIERMKTPIWTIPIPPRMIRVGDFVQSRESGRLGLVQWRHPRPRKSTFALQVHIVGDRSGIAEYWNESDVDLVHGTIRITERL